MNIRRDEKGRFLPGQAMPAGPGRPPRQTEQDYLAATIAEVSIDDWRKVVRQALTDAKKGNGYARQWLSEYLIGKPPQILDIRAADAKQLAELIELAKRLGRTPGELFEAMIAEFAALDAEVSDDAK